MRLEGNLPAQKIKQVELHGPASPEGAGQPVPKLQPGRNTPGPVADPDPALLEASAVWPGHALPRISEDGRAPMQVYAAGFDHSSLRPKVGLLVAGIGLDAAASRDAIRTLPGGVTLAISPYGHDLEKLLALARAAEHEYLVSVPMEPQGFPLNDAGPQALTGRVPREENMRRLDWALSRIQGYVGVTSALGHGLNGQRFTAVPGSLAPILESIARRGLLYVDPTPGAQLPPIVWNCDVDVIIDSTASANAIDDKLVELDRMAQQKGSALGLVGAVRPVTVQRIATWANMLLSKGLALAPVSALVLPPMRVQAVR